MNDSKSAGDSPPAASAEQVTTSDQATTPDQGSTDQGTDALLSKSEAAIRAAAGDLVLAIEPEFGVLAVTIGQESVGKFLDLCKSHTDLGFEMLIDITAVDWMDERAARFELVYQLLSISQTRRLTVRVPVSEDKPEVDSVTSLWAGANFLEREVWDMFGIKFKGNPDPRRILLYEEFVGHPLRKDYPVQAKQPRIPLRKPEVENTARDMRRPDLVNIRARRDRDNEQPRP